MFPIISPYHIKKNTDIKKTPYALADPRIKKPNEKPIELPKRT